jgi:hypothetical protein
VAAHVHENAAAGLLHIPKPGRVRPEMFFGLLDHVNLAERAFVGHLLGFDVFGSEEQFLGIHQQHPFCRQVSIMRSASSSVMQSGFSQTMCLPALAASIVICACKALGAAIVTISMSGLGQHLPVIGEKARQLVPFGKRLALPESAKRPPPPRLRPA